MLAPLACSRLFQSTRPVRGETRRAEVFPLPSSHFNPLAPCGARRAAPCFLQSAAPFQSTRPVRGETIQTSFLIRPHPISIHSPRAGRDFNYALQCVAYRNFNPLAPCGARLTTPAASVAALAFQSTRPVRGETSARPEPHTADTISIHSPRAGRDTH